MKALEFDEKFDNGDNITENLDLNSVKRINYNQKRINIDIPIWMIEKLDMEALRLGVPRQSVIKIWLSERLDTIRI